MRRVLALAAILGAALPAAAADLAGVPTGLSAIRHGHGWTFADAKGMTLYVYDRDEETPGKSNCKGDCATAWPPVLAAADAQPAGAWSLTARDDGAKQWAYKGKPLYTYAADAFPGAAFGDGVGTVWWAALQPIATPAEITVGPSVLGQVLRDAKGLTLYTSDADTKPGVSNCDKDCARTWKPVLAPWLANPSDDWSVAVRSDGSRQWAFKGKPLYRYADDVNPGESGGEKAGQKTGGGWHAAVLEPPPPVPPFVTVQASDAGELLATEKGMTLYAHGTDRRLRRFFNPSCKDGEECLDLQWVPLIAAKDAKPVGSWALLDLPDGSRQWTYKGQKVYTNRNDAKPGDFKGIRFGGDRSWAAIMRSGQPMQGVTVGG
jgi:predicted lipoprotein with Yx(FWY)xxD motif